VDRCQTEDTSLFGIMAFVADPAHPPAEDPAPPPARDPAPLRAADPAHPPPPDPARLPVSRCTTESENPVTGCDRPAESTFTRWRPAGGLRFRCASIRRRCPGLAGVRIQKSAEPAADRRRKSWQHAWLIAGRAVDPSTALWRGSEAPPKVGRAAFTIESTGYTTL
jgi:hypothetical protein